MVAECATVESTIFTELEPKGVWHRESILATVDPVSLTSEPQLVTSNRPPTLIPSNMMVSDDPPLTSSSAILKTLVTCMLFAVPGKVLYMVMSGAVTPSNTEFAPIEPTVCVPQ